MNDIVTGIVSRDNDLVMKWCAKCLKQLPVSEFASFRGNKFQSYCKSCNSDYQKKLRLNMTNEQKDQTNLQHKFKISLKEYTVLFELQKGICAICKLPEKHINGRTGIVQRLSVDHDHITGKIRSLLCQDCNAGFGFLHEDPMRIEALLLYICFHQSAEHLLEYKNLGKGIVMDENLCFCGCQREVVRSGKMSRLKRFFSQACRVRFFSRKKYGCTPEVYLDLYNHQKGLCAVCHLPPVSGKMLAPDHCHKTNTLRGLLCKDCNVGLGFFHDDPSRIMTLLEYSLLHYSVG